MSIYSKPNIIKVTQIAVTKKCMNNGVGDPDDIEQDHGTTNLALGLYDRT